MKLAICLLIFSLSTLTFTGIAQARTKSGTAVKAKAGKTVKAKTSKKKKIAKVQYGTASFYSNTFIGKETASGEIFSQKKLTAAHNSLPMGTWIKVTNLKNRKSVIVKITDRLHYRNRRILDLSRAAAAQLSFFKSGVASIKLEILDKSSPLITAK